MGGGGCCIGNCCVANRVKEFFRKIFGKSSGSSSGGDTESYDRDKADIEMTLRVQQALTDFRTDTQSRSEQLENDIVKESREYLDEFLAELRRYNKIQYGRKRLNLNLNSLERENRKTEDMIHGFIVKRVSKRISLDDAECTDILKMDRGKKKEEAFSALFWILSSFRGSCSKRCLTLSNFSQPCLRVKDFLKNRTIPQKQEINLPKKFSSKTTL